jgi:hypothetical protein
MYQGNAAHTGYIPVSFDPNDFTLDWEVTLGPLGQPLTPVTAVDGRVFVSKAPWYEFEQPDLYGLDADSGEILWSHDFGDVYSVNPPAYDAGQVYVQVVDNTPGTFVYVYDASTGVRLHQEPMTAQWEKYFAPTIVAGTAYMNGGWGGGMYAFNFLEEPPQRWFIDLAQVEGWTPAVDGVNAYAFTAKNQPYDAALTVVSCRDGTEVMTILDPGSVDSDSTVNLAPVLGGRGDVLVIHHSRLISFDVVNGAINYAIEDEFGHSGQASVAKGVLYMINDFAMEARDQNTGALLWSWFPPGDFKVFNTIIVTDEHALVFVRDAWPIGDYYEAIAVHAIDLETHQSVWSYEVPWNINQGIPPTGHLAWSEGRLFISRSDGVLTALELSSPYQQSAVIQFSPVTYSFSESAGYASVTLKRSGSPVGAVGVTVTSSDGTATFPSDYTSVNQSVSWTDGDSADKTVQIPIVNDTEIEEFEHLTVRMHSVTGSASIGSPDHAVITIRDDDVDTIRFSSPSTDVSESGSNLTVYVLREGPASGEVGVDWTTVDGAAIAGSDFTATSGRVSWDSGDTMPKPLVISVLDDEIEEDEESFSVALSNPTGNSVLGAPAVFSVGIVDDDGPRVQFGASSCQVAETANSVDLVVRRLGSAEGDISVQWATSDGTGTAGRDYVADSGTLEWESGDQTDKSVSVSILDDVVTEGGETFAVALSDPVGDVALGEPHRTVVSIIDDEATEWLIPTETEYGQMRPRVAVNSSGNGVAVWDSWRQDGWGWGVFAQRLDDEGLPAGGEFRVNQTTDEDQMDGAVAIADDGSFIVVWEAAVSGAPRIMARRYGADGSPLGGEFMVNSSPPGTQTDPRVAVDGGGRFMVVWSGRDDSGAGAVGRVFGTDGGPLGAEFVLNATTYLSQSSPSVAGRPGGGFVTVWESYGQDDYDSDAVVARIVAADGSPAGGEFRVNSHTEGNQSLPSVAVTGDGAFLVVWEDDSGLDGAFGSIRGQWHSASGAAVGEEFQINAFAAGHQGRPGVAADEDGRAVVVWEGRNNQDGSETGVFGRVLHQGGAFASGEIQYNTYTARQQYLPDVACSESGRVLAVWTSEQQDGSAEGVYGVSWPLPPAERIFADGFESGHMTAWSASSP